MVACYCVDENLGKCPISVGDPLEMSSLTQLTGNRRDNSKSKKRKTNKQRNKGKVYKEEKYSALQSTGTQLRPSVSLRLTTQALCNALDN